MPPSAPPGAPDAGEAEPCVPEPDPAATLAAGDSPERRRRSPLAGGTAALAAVPESFAEMPPSAAAPSLASTATLADRKSTRLNSSHVKRSYAVSCLIKKKKQKSDRCQMP